MSKPYLFDSHTHTHFAAYKNDSVKVIARALDKNIWIVNVGTQKDTSAKAVQIANQYEEGVYATVGLHPIHTERSYHDEQELGAMENRSPSENGSPQISGFTSRGEDFDYEYYKNLAQDKKVVAIGECGIDYYRIVTSNQESVTREKQKQVFLQHIKLSHEIKKPLMIHCRSAFPDLIQILITNHKLLITGTPGIIHFFSGTVDDAKKLLDLGFSFSFGGVITFARDYDEQIKYIPMDRILLETDAPYVTPIPFRGKRNEPMHVEEVAKKFAEIKGLSLDEVAEKTTENAIKIFAIT